MDTYYYLRGPDLVSGHPTRSAGQRIDLTPDPTTFAVGIKARTPLSATAVQILKEIKAREPAEFIPQYNIRVMRSEQVGRAIRVLAEEPAVDFVAPAFRQSPQSSDLMFITDKFVAQFIPGMRREQIDEFNAGYGVSIVRELKMSPNTYVLKAPGGEGATAIDLANRYFESGKTLFSHPDFVTRKHFRSSVAVKRRARGAERAYRGEFSTQQWHLTKAKVTDAWSITKGDSGIRIAVLDDGIDTGHPEFSGKVTWEYDYEGHVQDGSPKTGSDKHGTACAGVAVAAGVKADGAAPGCSLIAVRTPYSLGVSDEAQMFNDACDQGADVISCSWGPPDGAGTVDPLPDATRVAIHYCQTNGRGGKGIPICWAAGNGNESVSNDGYAANPEVLAIAASTDHDERSWYSDFGPEICIAAPSNGGDKEIFTTDRLGANGYNPGSVAKGDAAGSYCNNFGGTSSATPLVAGTIGLMLSANPNLTCAEVRDILQSTAEKVGPSSDYDSQGHSHNFGYGRLNAKAAVEQASNLAGGGVAPSRPSVTADAQVDFSGASPTFFVDAAGNGYYHLEVAARTELLVDAAGRDNSNYFASWDVEGFIASSGYTLPVDRWELLKGCERLYYRVWTSSSSEAWLDYMVSTDDADIASAPSIEIVGGQSGGGETAERLAPVIVAPGSLGRDGDPPQFEVEPGSNGYYHVEVAADPALFASEAGRDASNYFASWDVTGFISTASYWLPLDAWSNLYGQERLYYRAWSSDTDVAWSDVMVSTADEEAASAPYVELTSGGRARDGGASRARTRSVVDELGTAMPPTITATEHCARDEDAPAFLIDAAGQPNYRVEIATRPELLGSEPVSEASAGVYRSEMLRAPATAGGFVYRMPEGVWRKLQAAPRIYYRVATSRVDGHNELVSHSAESAPWVVIDATSSRRDAVGDHYEASWSGPHP